jgi:hypothetical protein
MISVIQTSLERNLTLEEKVKLCNSRIPMMRHKEGWLQIDLICPLPIWSPVPEKYRRTAQDSFSIWGLEAQHPKYLLEILKPFVCVEKRGRGKPFLTLLEGAYKKAHNDQRASLDLASCPKNPYEAHEQETPDNEESL